MLSEAVLVDIARPGPTQQMVVAAAWPSLAVESRLQVIAAVQGGGINRSTPDWLLDLAMQDDAAIVRYWAARSAYFREEGPFDLNEKMDQGFFKRKPAAPEDLARARAARSDSSELVRLSVDRLGILGGGDVLTSMPQLQRLIAIRNDANPTFSAFIDWLCRAVEEQIPDDELASCSAEFFAHVEVIAKMKVDDFEDGYAAHLEGQAVTNAWALLKGKAGPSLTAQLVWLLPVKRGFGSVTADELSSMPDRVLANLLHRRGDGATFVELAELIRRQPERFSPDIVKSLKRDDEDYFPMPDADAMEEHRLTNAVDRQAATVEAVIGLRREIVRLSERVDEVHEAATRKRGFFG